MKKKSFLSKVQNTIQSFRMIPPRARVLVAVSAGIDSVVLLHVLRELLLSSSNTNPCSLPLEGGDKRGGGKRSLTPHLNLSPKGRGNKEEHHRLAVIHFNHKLRSKSSDRDESFVRKLAKKYGIEFFGGQGQVKEFAKTHQLSLEDAARRMRYAFFDQTAKRHGFTHVALAHHEGDQAEGILMRLLRGSGLRGLRAALPVRKTNGITYIRPFIELSRDEILTYLKFKKLSFRTDFSNRDQQFLRNRVRHKLIPFLEKYFHPEAKSILATSARIVSLEYAFLEQEAVRHFKKLTLQHHEGEWVLDQTKWLKLHPALQFRVLQMMCEKLKAPNALSPEKMKQVLRQLRTQSKGEIQLTSRVALSFQYGKITLREVSSKRTKSQKLYLNSTVKIPQSQLSVSIQNVSYQEAQKVIQKKKENKNGAAVEFFDASKIKFPLIVRTRKAGDYIVPFGSQSPKKLKTILIDRKIPKWKRDEMVIVEGKVESQQSIVHGKRKKNIIPSDCQALAGGGPFVTTRNNKSIDHGLLTMDSPSVILTALGACRSAHAPVTSQTQKIYKLSIENPCHGN